MARCSATWSNLAVHLDVNETSTSIEGNYSVVSWSLWMQRPYSISSSVRKNYSVSIDGQVASGTTSIGGSGDFTIASGTCIIGHDGNGDKAIGFSFSQELKINYNGYVDTLSSNGSMWLSHINRYFSRTPTITQTDLTETSVSYNWATSENANLVKWGCRCADEQERIDTVYSGSGSSSGSFTISNLTPGKQYDIWIYAVRADSGLGSDSAHSYPIAYNYPYISSISVPELIIGDSQTINLYNPLDRECSIYMRKGSDDQGTLLYSDDIEEGTSLTFTPDSDDLYSTIPNDKESDCVYYCVYDNHRTQYLSGKYKISGEENPIFTTSNISDIEDSLAVLITGDSNVFIKTNNQLHGVISPMTSNSYAGLDNGYYSISSNGIETITIPYSDSDQTFVLNNVADEVITITAVDNRNMIKTISFNVQVIDYTLPYLTECVIARQNGTGTYADVKLKGLYTNWENLLQDNEIKDTFKYRYKRADSDDSYSNWVSITDADITNSDGEWTMEAVLDTVFSNVEKYDIQFKFEDLLNSIESTIFTISTANALMWRDLSNKRVGINKKPDYTFDVNGDINSNTLYIEEEKMIWYDTNPDSYFPIDGDSPIGISKSIFDVLYPIGSYYETSNADWTPTLAHWYGTWVEDTAGLTTVAIDNGTFDTLDDVIGEESHTLTVNEIPSHSHTLTSYYDDANYNTGTIPSDYGRYSLPYDAGDTIRHQRTDESGGGNAFNVIQPSIVVRRWHRIG